MVTKLKSSKCKRLIKELKNSNARPKEQDKRVGGFIEIFM